MFFWISVTLTYLDNFTSLNLYLSIVENSERDGNTRPADLPLEKSVYRLELDMEQQTGSKSRKEYVKAVYCHPAYLTYMQSTA